MNKELKVEMNQRVQIANLNQLNYPLRGTVVAQATEPDGTKMSRVQFKSIACWYLETDLKAVPLKPEEHQDDLQKHQLKQTKGIRTVKLECPECETVFMEDLPSATTTYTPCLNVFCDKAVSVTDDLLSVYELGETVK